MDPCWNLTTEGLCIYRWIQSPITFLVDIGIEAFHDVDIELRAFIQEQDEA